MRKPTVVDWVPGDSRDRARRKTNAEYLREHKQRQKNLGALGNMWLTVYAARTIISRLDAYIKAAETGRSRSSVIVQAIQEYIQKYERTETA